MIFWISWCIKDLWGTKFMYCYVLKLLFLITQLYFLKQAATFIYSEVHGWTNNLSLPILNEYLLTLFWKTNLDQIWSITKNELELIKAPTFSRTVFTSLGFQSCYCQNSLFIIIQRISNCGILTIQQIVRARLPTFVDTC